MNKKRAKENRHQMHKTCKMEPALNAQKVRESR